MMVYVAVINYEVEGYENYTHTTVVGTFRTESEAENALKKAYDFIESDPKSTVTDLICSATWLD